MDEETRNKLRHLGDSPAAQAWDLKQWPPFLETFGRFDPEGRGEMLASDVSVVNLTPAERRLTDFRRRNDTFEFVSAG